jgi:hypothetical protein
MRPWFRLYSAGSDMFAQKPAVSSFFAMLVWMPKWGFLAGGQWRAM